MISLVQALVIAFFLAGTATGNVTVVVGVGSICLVFIGNARLRCGLYMPAIIAKRYNPACHGLADWLTDKQKHGKVIVIAVMRKLVHQV